MHELGCPVGALPATQEPTACDVGPNRPMVAPTDADGSGRCAVAPCRCDQGTGPGASPTPPHFPGISYDNMNGGPHRAVWDRPKATGAAGGAMPTR